MAYFSLVFGAVESFTGIFFSSTGAKPEGEGEECAAIGQPLEGENGNRLGA